MFRIYILVALILSGVVDGFSFPSVGWGQRVRNSASVPPRDPALGLDDETVGGVPDFLLATGRLLKKVAPPGSNRRNFIKSIGKVVTISVVPSLFTSDKDVAAAAAGGPLLKERPRAPPAAEPTTIAPTKAPWLGPSSIDSKAKREVLDATQLWLDTVTSGKPSTPADTTALYAKEGVLWGTVSEQLRVNPQEIRDYFDHFARLPGLRVAAYQPFIRVFGDMAINDGYYIFAWDGPDGEVLKNARFSFVYKKTEDGKWMIMDHHSSLIPTAPAKLKVAKSVVL